MKRESVILLAAAIAILVTGLGFASLASAHMWESDYDFGEHYTEMQELHYQLASGEITPQEFGQRMQEEVEEHGCPMMGW